MAQRDTMLANRTDGKRHETDPNHQSRPHYYVTMNYQHMAYDEMDFEGANHEDYGGMDYGVED